MQKVLTAKQMREVDRLTTEKYGIPPLLLMENAAHAAARIITEKCGGSVKDKTVLILCGTGNNGGDGAALARVLWMCGADVEVCLFGSVADTTVEARANFEILQKISEQEGFELAQADIAFEEIASKEEWEDFVRANYHYDDPEIMIDALFGTGLKRPLEDVFAEVAAFTRSFNVGGEGQTTLVVALDVPSGLSADKYERIGNNPCAHLTVSFTAPKLANVFPPAANSNGELRVVNIGTPCELIDKMPSQTFVAECRDAGEWLCKTQVCRDSYKKTRGTALIIAGSKNYTGAAILAANACFAAGAGMVTAAAPNSVRDVIAARVAEEIITHGFAETKNGAFTSSAARNVLKLSEKNCLTAIGCGLSADDESTRKFVREVVTKRKTPMIIDADGLNSLAPFDLSGSDDLPLVLTPHIGEFERLLGDNKKEFLRDRIAVARRFAKDHNVILLLKGERSLIAAPDGRVVINPTGNAGISRAGAGDTLTGIIAAFLAQIYGIEKPTPENTFETVVAALYTASLAGDIAAEKFSQRLMTAVDIRECLGAAMKKISAE